MRFGPSVVDIVFSPAQFKVAGFLLAHEAPMSEREIASVLKISHMSVNRAMAALSAVNFAACRRVGSSHLWTVNRKSHAYAALNAVIGAVRAQASPLAALKETILRHLPKERVARAVLFGSIPRGEEREDSDIDLLIVVRTARDKDALEPFLDQLSTACLDMFGNRLAPYVLSVKEWKEKQSLPVVQAAEKGEVLYEPKI